jgi:hypothetical protein
LVTLSLAFGLAAGGQGLLNHDKLWAGALLYGLALLLVSWTARSTTAVRQPDPLGGLTRELQIKRGAAKGLGVAAAGGVLVFSVVAYRAFGAQSTRGWVYYLLGLAYLVVATLLLTRGKGLAYLWPRTWLSRVVLAVILLLALGLRLWQLGSLPAGTWYDEALSGLQGAQWLEDPAYRPQFENRNNNSGQMIWLYATAQRWFGHGTWAIRLVPALLGVAGVLAAYLFGSELRGPRFGLAMAFTLAVARWHVNFSRIAMPGIDTPLFVFASLFTLTRLLRSGRLRDAVWAGISLGLGLSAYSAFRLFVLALGLTLVLSLLRWRRSGRRAGEGRGWLRLGVRLGALALALWLAALPVVHFSLNQPVAFWYRVRKTSLFHNREEPDLALALGRSTRQHLLMFNVAGDRNGRHNLYGEPILDPAMGVLFVLGLGLALVRVREPANLFFAVLLPIGLLGGILSLDYEAPQSLRSIAAMPAVIYYCALSFSMLVDRLEKGVQFRLAAAWRAIPVLALGAYLLAINAHTYFVRQAGDLFSWSAFSTAESIAGQRLAELGPGYRTYLSPLYVEHPSIRFLAPEVHDQRPLDLPDALPIRQPADRPAALFIHPDDRWVYDAAQSLYPAATFKTVYGPAGRTPVLYVVTLSGADIAGVQGLELHTWSGQEWKGHPAWVVRDAAVDGRLSDVLLQEDARAAEWSGVLYAPEYGLYEFTFQAPAGATLDLDGQTVVVPADEGERTVALELAQGNHSLRIRARARPGQVRLMWQPPGGQMEVVPQWALYAPPVGYNGLQGSYYTSAAWEGTPALVRVDPFLDTYYHLTPLPRPYSAEWVCTSHSRAPINWPCGRRTGRN